MPTVVTNALSHRYARGGASLHDIDLSVPEGAIFGFLGPNGAGKSTVLRLLLGLLRLQRGSVTIFGKSFATHRIEVLRDVGSLIEAPSLYEHLTARENLVLHADVRGIPRARVDDTLRLVGLADTANKRVAQFSLGMKQRLGIAIAVLHRPKLLVLDEPTNGLDAHGTIEMRELLQRLHRERETTILVSSHVLAEVERLATHIAILANGRLRFQGTLDRLREQHGAAAHIALRTDDDARALGLIADEIPAAARDGACIALPPLPPAALARINRRLVERGIGVHEIARSERDLESIFMELVA
ncbi:MAG: ABC transporter ATP-binding protein [Rhodanobacteraceae bacterium]